MYDENMQYQTEVDNEVDGLDSHCFVEKELYPALQEIIHAYQNGTDFSIYMDGRGRADSRGKRSGSGNMDGCPCRRLGSNSTARKAG